MRDFGIGIRDSGFGIFGTGELAVAAIESRR
jgi:hypothetical protein